MLKIPMHNKKEGLRIGRGGRRRYGDQGFFPREARILEALLIREMKNRFGRFTLGYAWAVLEPLGYVAAFSMIRMALGSGDLAGLTFPIFFTTGIIPFLLFSSTLMQSLLSIRANKGLFNYRRVKPYHVVLARHLLESGIYFLSGLVILVVFYWSGFTFRIHSLLGALWILFLFNLFCLGLGFIMSVLGPLFRESEKILPIAIRPLFLISGIFFPTIHVPREYHHLLFWNPVLHVIELLRYHLFESYRAPFTSSAYLAVISLLILVIGLVIYKAQEHALLTSGKIRVR